MMIRVPHRPLKLLLSALFAFLSGVAAQPASAQAPAVRDGYVEVPGGKVWYRIAGSGTGTPLLTLHGGPGGACDYLFSLDALSDERPVIYYDQLGSGKSDHPKDLSLWTTTRFVDELAAVRKALGLEKIHLLGHSWGTMLAAEYIATKHPAGIESLILSSSAVSTTKWMEDAKILVAQLPAELQAAIRKNEEAGTTDSPEYVAATMEYYKRFMCRLDPWPDALTNGMPNPDVYGTMWGPSEFRATGTLRDFDRSGALRTLTMPVLYTAGRYDECRPETAAWYQSLTPGSSLVIIENSGHLTSLDQPEAYAKAVREFLHRIETRAPSR
jgi:proline iminopeptidase